MDNTIGGSNSANFYVNIIPSLGKNGVNNVANEIGKVFGSNQVNGNVSKAGGKLGGVLGTAIGSTLGSTIGSTIAARLKEISSVAEGLIKKISTSIGNLFND